MNPLPSPNFSDAECVYADRVIELFREYRGKGYGKSLALETARREVQDASPFLTPAEIARADRYLDQLLESG